MRLLVPLFMCLIVNRTPLVLTVDYAATRITVTPFTTNSVPSTDLKIRSGEIVWFVRCEDGQRLILEPNPLEGGFKASVK